MAHLQTLVRKLPYRQMPSVFTSGSKAWHGACSASLCEERAAWAVLFHVERPGIPVNRWEGRCHRHGDHLQEPS